MKKKLLYTLLFSLLAAQPASMQAMNRQTLPVLFGAAIIGASFFAGYSNYFLAEPKAVDSVRLVTVDALLEDLMRDKRYRTDYFYYEMIRDHFPYSYAVLPTYTTTFKVTSEGNTSFSFSKNYYALKKERYIAVRHAVETICTFPAENAEVATKILLGILFAQEVNIALYNNDYKTVAQLLKQDAFIDGSALAKLFKAENKYLTESIEALFNEKNGASTFFHVNNDPFKLSKTIVTSKKELTKLEKILTHLQELGCSSEELIAMVAELVKRNTEHCITFSPLYNWPDSENKDRVERFGEKYTNQQTEHYTKFILTTSKSYIKQAK